MKGRLSGGFSLGLLAGSATAFLVPDSPAKPSSLSASVTVHADVSGKSIGVSLLEANFASGSNLDYSGSVTLKLKDPTSTDARITAGDISGFGVAQIVQVSDTQVFDITLTANIGAGVDVTNSTGQLVNLATATLKIKSPAGGASIFGSPSGRSDIDVTFDATPGSTRSTS